MIPQHKFRLLPNYYKKIGLTISVLSILSVLLLRILDIHLGINKEYYGDIFFNIILLGMFIVAFSKEKIEDERVRDFRYKSLSSALIFGLMMTIFHAPISFFIFNDEYQILSAQQVMLLIMIWYLIVFSAIRHEEKEGRKEE